MLENIATLMVPPASAMPEGQWLRQTVKASDAPLLLDLHNLHANAVNLGGALASEPRAILMDLPLEHVGTVHIAGGRWLAAGQNFLGEPRWLDDHLHPVPDAVFALLEELAAFTLQPLTVVLERDGAYPAMEGLLSELDMARAAMRRGRERRRQISAGTTEESIDDSSTSSLELEALLARVYTDEVARVAFLASPEEFSRRHGLNRKDAVGLAAIDRVGLTMAAQSFARKRELKAVAHNRHTWIGGALRMLKREPHNTARLL